ncbi:MAG: MATE family efflux transporter [Betaproteobacteria bacterium]
MNVPPAPTRNARVERLLHAPIAPTVLRLAAPGIVLVGFQSAVSITDAYFVGRLGTAPLAGLSLVFPMLMLLQMMSAGAMGGGVASAIARALGAGNEQAARSLTVHAMVIGASFGLVFTLCILAAGPSLYRLLGGRSTVLDAALAYSDIIFSGAVLVWLANTLASILRGAGNMVVPALALGGATLVHVPLSGMLVLGGGPLPAMGIAGAGVAYLANFGFASAAMLAYLLRRGSRLRPGRADLRLNAGMFWEILRVGAISSLNSMLTVLTAVLLTGIVGSYGTAALAGYGVGVRLELMQVPLVFAIGQALVAHIGTNIGAGQVGRAKHIAWTGALLAACVGLAIGAFVALFPLAWAGLFSTDPAVLEACSQYLRRVAPCYPFLSVGVALYFASQGAGRMAMPLLAGAFRLMIATAGGFAAVRAGAPVSVVFLVIATAMFVYGSFTAWAVWRADWATRSPAAARPA